MSQAQAVAIPSYNRPGLFMNRTYKILVASELLDKTTIFCVPEQETLYRNLPPIRDGRLALVVGVRGLIQQKQYIYDFYPEGTEVVMMDDDLEHFITWDKKVIRDIRPIIHKGFRHCRDRGARLWGIYPVANPFFFSRDVSYGLKFIIGNLYGVIKRGGSEIPADVISHKEDIYRSCAYFKRDGVIVRINDVAPVTKFLAGDSLEASKEWHEQGADRIVQDFPGYAKKYYRRRTGFAEVRLRKIDSLVAPH
jgi:hypothetical protein